MGTEMIPGRYGQPSHRPDPYHPVGPRVVHGGRLGQGHDNSHFVSMKNPGKKDSFSRFAGLGVGISSVVAEHVLSHPCIVLRRQCQVNHDSGWFHITPFTLFTPIFNIQRHQSITTLWKGIGSTFMVKGISVATEAAISEFTPLPKEVNRHSSLKKHLQHLILKGLGILVATPFYAASLVETVQSEIASEQPGVFECLSEGMSRMFGLSTAQTTRLLPVWKLVPFTVAHGVIHYTISSLAQYTVLLSIRTEMMEAKEQRPDEASDKSMYETYYPELIATFTGCLLADTLLYPFESVLHRLLVQGTRTIIDNTDNGLGVVPVITRYEGIVDCCKSIILEEGLSGFYKGFGALLLQYGLHVAILKLTQFILKQVTPEKLPPLHYSVGSTSHTENRKAGHPVVARLSKSDSSL